MIAKHGLLPHMGAFGYKWFGRHFFSFATVRSMMWLAPQVLGASHHRREKRGRGYHLVLPGGGGGGGGGLSRASGEGIAIPTKG